MQSTENLVVARYARKLAVLAYQVTAHFPRTEQFGITVQMRRAALSIGSNIAEGCGRSTKKQFIHSLDQAAGEASELEYQCAVAVDMHFGKTADVERLQAETIRVKKMLARLMAYLRTQTPRKQKGNSRREFPLDHPNN